MSGHDGHVGIYLTTPAPRAARPPVQREVEIVGRRPVEAYVELTLRAPEIAERAEAGQFVAFAVGGATSALLLRRAIAISTAADGAVTVVVSPHGPGSTWLAERQGGDRVDVVGPLGRPFPLPEPGTRALLVGGGYGAAALVGLAERLRERGHAVDVVAGAAAVDRLCSVQELTEIADRIELTTDDGSRGRQGLVTLAVADFLGRAGEDRAGVVYACGPMPMLRAVAEAAGERGIPSYVAVEEAMACGIGVCMTCVLPIVGEDGRTRFARSCTDGPVFGGDRVRFADVGSLPADVVGADAMGVISA
jgi:dihydroorotate dehydrogenase electron transfer subunit